MTEDRAMVVARLGHADGAALAHAHAVAEAAALEGPRDDVGALALGGHDEHAAPQAAEQSSDAQLARHDDGAAGADDAEAADPPRDAALERDELAHRADR